MKKLLKLILLLTLTFLLFLWGCTFYFKYSVKQFLTEKKLREVLSTINAAQALPENFKETYKKAYPNVFDNNFNTSLLKTLLGIKQHSPPSRELAADLWMYIGSNRSNFVQKMHFLGFVWILEENITQEKCFEYSLSRFDFCNNQLGIRNASIFLYNKPIDSLALDEQLGLIILLDNPSYYDKLRYPERNEKAVNELLFKIIGRIKEPKIDQYKIEHVHALYFAGDINNDKIPDSAFVEYDRKVSLDGTIEKECVNKDCQVKIKFSSPIPEFIVPQSLGIYIQKTEDLNNDKANEILLFSEWFEGYWHAVYVWTFKNGEWKELARTKAFLSEDEDYENRIIKNNSHFYLIGDGWDDSKGGVTEKTIKVKMAN